MPKKILVVDDDIHVLMMVEARLKGNGFSVIAVSSGEAALQMAREQKPDLILLDVAMPPPNGYQVCQTLKSDPEYRTIPIIMLTAKSSENDRFWGMEAGADGYLTKPYDPLELLNQIYRLLDA